MRWTALQLVALLAAFLAPAVAALGQTSIVVRPSATADLTKDISLGSIATLTGPDAERIGAIVVSAKPAAAKGAPASITIDPAQIRSALDRANVNWARITLSGVRCEVRAASIAPSAAPAEIAKRDLKPAPETVDLAGPPTVRTLIAVRLTKLYGIANEDLRVRFVSASAEDETLLATPVDSSRRVEVQPGASSSAGRMGMRVDVYQGDRLTASRTIAVEALIRREGCVAMTNIERGKVVSPGDIVPDTRWLAASADTPVPPDQVIGQSARRRIEAGRPIVADDVRPTITIKRGDEVVVHTLSGGVVLKSRARAISAAREGEMVELRRDGSKTSFFARAGTKGVAVVDLASAPPPTENSEPAKSQSQQDRVRNP